MDFTVYANTPSVIDLWSVDSDGIHQTSSTPTTFAHGMAKPERVGTKLVGRLVVDTATGATLGTLPMTSPFEVVVDEAHGKIYAWGYVGSGSMLISYDLNTLQPLAYMNISGAAFFQQ